MPPHRPTDPASGASYFLEFSMPISSLPSLAAAPAVAAIAALLPIFVLATLVAYIVRRVTHRARPEDLPEIFTALSQILVALARFLPWARADNADCAPPLLTQCAEVESLRVRGEPGVRENH